MNIVPTSGFDWDRPVQNRKSLNDRWVRLFEHGEYDSDFILDGFLNMPHPSTGSQLDELRSINLGGALEDMQRGHFKGSLIWLHDFDGNRGRDYNGVMDAKEAWKNLQYNRIGQDNMPDACVRRFHLHNPTAESMAVLVHAVSLDEISLLKTFLWNHIRGRKAIIQFNIRDGRTYSLNCHIPSFALRKVDPEGAIPEDTREKTNGKPWRVSRKLPFLSKNERYVLHETQLSLNIFGSSLDTWKAMMLHDTYYHPPDPDNPDTVKFYEDNYEDANADPASPSDSESDSGSDPDTDFGSDFEFEWDPSAIGTKEARLVSANPCVGFFVVFLERATQLHDEWAYTSNMVEEGVSKYLEKHGVSATMEAATPTQESVQRLKDFERHSNWVTDTQEVLTLLTQTLSSIVDTWKAFCREDLPHIPKLVHIHFIIMQINNTFRKLHDILDIFEALDAKCRHFKKKLELDICVQAGPVVVQPQDPDVTFVQATGPIVVSASIVQAQIINVPQPYPLLVFCTLAVGFFSLNWYLHPHLNPLPRAKKKLAGRFRGNLGLFRRRRARPGVTGEERSPDTVPRRLSYRPSGFSELWPPSRALGTRALVADSYELGEYPRDTLPMPVTMGQRPRTGVWRS